MYMYSAARLDALHHHHGVVSSWWYPIITVASHHHSSGTTSSQWHRISRADKVLAVAKPSSPWLRPLFASLLVRGMGSKYDANANYVGLLDQLLVYAHGSARQLCHCVLVLGLEHLELKYQRSRITFLRVGEEFRKALHWASAQILARYTGCALHYFQSKNILLKFFAKSRVIFCFKHCCIHQRYRQYNTRHFLE